MSNNSTRTIASATAVEGEGEGEYIYSMVIENMMAMMAMMAMFTMMYSIQKCTSWYRQYMARHHMARYCVIGLGPLSAHSKKKKNILSTSIFALWLDIFWEKISSVISEWNLIWKRSEHQSKKSIISSGIKYYINVSRYNSSCLYEGEKIVSGFGYTVGAAEGLVVSFIAAVFVSLAAVCAVGAANGLAVGCIVGVSVGFVVCCPNRTIVHNFIKRNENLYTEEYRDLISTLCKEVENMNLLTMLGVCSCFWNTNAEVSCKFLGDRNNIADIVSEMPPGVIGTMSSLIDAITTQLQKLKLTSMYLNFITETLSYNLTRRPPFFIPTLYDPEFIVMTKNRAFLLDYNGISRPDDDSGTLYDHYAIAGLLLRIYGIDIITLLGFGIDGTVLGFGIDGIYGIEQLNLLENSMKEDKNIPVYVIDVIMWLLDRTPTVDELKLVARYIGVIATTNQRHEVSERKKGHISPLEDLQKSQKSDVAPETAPTFSLSIVGISANIIRWFSVDPETAPETAFTFALSIVGISANILSFVDVNEKTKFLTLVCLINQKNGLELIKHLIQKGRLGLGL